MSQTTPAPRLSDRNFLRGLAIVLAGVLLTAALSGCKQDADPVTRADGASARSKEKVEELVWLEDFKLCLSAPGVPSELMNGMEDDLTTRLSRMDRASVCPCLSNGFAKAMDRKTTPNGTLRWMGNYPRQDIVDRVNTFRKDVALACIKDPAAATPQTLPDMSSTALDNLRQDAQKLYDEAGWDMDQKSCRDDAASGLNNISNVAQCDCRGAKMIETFGYKRPFNRNSIFQVGRGLKDSPDDLRKMDLIKETCAAPVQPASQP